MKNINRDYLVTVDAKTAKITPSPKDMVFFTTDENTSNIFFQLEGLDNSNSALQEDANKYSLTLRVVKPNNEPKTIEVEQLGEETSLYYVADLDVSFVDIPGFYDCELFVYTTINGREERSTSDPFQYEVKKSIFYNLDDMVDFTYISIEDIATKEYVNDLAVGGVSLDGYVTTEQLNTKANKEHAHSEYITQTQLNNTLVNGVDINLKNLVVNNSISIKRKESSNIGRYSTAEGYETTASGDYSHAEGLHSIASGESSHAEGYQAVASGYASHAEGFYTIARGGYQHVQGKYNIENTNDYAHIVGNGTSTTRSNAHTVDWDGNAWFAGDVFIGGISQYFGSKKLATEDYVVDALINAGADSDHTHDEYLTKVPDEYITQTELNEALGDIGTGNIDLSAYAKLNENATFKNIEARGEIKGLLLDLSDGTATSRASYNMVIGQGCGVTHYNSLVTGYNNYSSCNNQIVAGRMAYVNEGMTYFDRPLIIGNGTEEYVGESWEIRPTNAFYLDWSGNGTFMGTSTAKSHANSSDRTLKENINYISNASTINDESMTLAECYDFIKNDLAIATYNYIEDEAPKIGFIAQDLLYNADQTDNKVGQLIIDNFQGTDMGKGENKLTYDSNNLFGVMLAAMQVMANKIEYLEQKLEDIEGDK